MVFLEFLFLNSRRLYCFVIVLMVFLGSLAIVGFSISASWNLHAGFFQSFISCVPSHHASCASPFGVLTVLLLFLFVPIAVVSDIFFTSRCDKTTAKITRQTNGE